MPARLLETRAGLSTVDGQSNGIGMRDPPGTYRVDVTGRGGVPADAAAVVLNVTVTDAQAPGYVTVYPCGSDARSASNLNYHPPAHRPQRRDRQSRHRRQVCIYTQAATHLITDVSGYFPS